MNKYKEINIDLIMLSKFGKNDGGRETWAYNFLPQLLNSSEIKLNVFGYSDKPTPVHNDFLTQFTNSCQHKINVDILRGVEKKKPKAISMFTKLRCFLKEVNYTKPTHVIAMGIFELVFMLSSKRFKDAKKIVWLRGIFLNEKANRIPKGTLWLFKIVEKILLNRADIILANGKDIKDYYEKNYKLNVAVIENGIDFKKWSMDPPNLSNVIKVAYIGRLSKVKGIEDYLKLIEKIKKSQYYDNFEFHIVGDAGSYYEQLIEFQENDYIEYHGSIDNDKLPSFLMGIDVCVALTYSSPTLGGGGTSNALMEQMAASKVIIAWDNPIFRQLLCEDSAYLAEQHSVDELMEALIQIHNNKSLAIIKSAKSREKIIPYSLPKQVDKFTSLL